MKKFGIFLILVGIALIAYPYVFKGNGALGGGTKNLGEYTRPVVTSINLRSKNENKPQNIVFNLGYELSCFSLNEFSFDCTSYTKKVGDFAPSTIRASTLKSDYSIDEIANNYKNQSTGRDMYYYDYPICKENMRCVKGDETIHYNGSKPDEIQSVIYLTISNEDNYYTNLIIYFYSGEDQSKIDDYMNTFIYSITFEPYVDETQNHKDGKLEITLTVPRFNEDSKIKVYLSEDKYRYPLSAYENTNDSVMLSSTKTHIEDVYGGIHVADSTTIKYLYIEDNMTGMSLLELFDIQAGSPAIDSQKKPPKVIDGKEIYYGSDARFNHYMYIINNHYAYYVKTSAELNDEDLRELFDFKYE